MASPMGPQLAALDHLLRTTPMKLNAHGALAALLLLTAACQPQPEATVAPHGATTREADQPGATADVPRPAGNNPPSTVADNVDVHETTHESSGDVRVHNAQQALDLLVAQLERDHVYADRCHSYEYEQDTGQQDGYVIGVREKHDGDCADPATDPSTAPILDWYEVRTDGSLLWMDVVTDDYVPYAERSARLNQSQ